MKETKDEQCQTSPSLFDLPPRSTRLVQAPAPPPIIVPAIPTLQDLDILASNYGYNLVRLTEARDELFDRLQQGMKARTGRDTYQSRAWFVRHQSASQLGRILRFLAVTNKTRGQTKKIWESQSPEQLRTAINLVGAHPFAMGISKGIKGHSIFIRVIATLITLRVEYAVCRKGKSYRAYVNYMYALIDEAGEVTLPQDQERRTIPMSESEIQPF